MLSVGDFVKRLGTSFLVIAFGFFLSFTAYAACAETFHFPLDVSQQTADKKIIIDWSGEPCEINLKQSFSGASLESTILGAQTLEPLANGIVPRALLGFTIKNKSGEVVTGPLASFDCKQVTSDNQASLKIHQWALNAHKQIIALNITPLFAKIPVSDLAEFAKFVRSDSRSPAALDLEKCLKNTFDDKPATHHEEPQPQKRSKPLCPPPGFTQPVVQAAQIRFLPPQHNPYVNHLLWRICSLQQMNTALSAQNHTLLLAQETREKESLSSNAQSETEPIDTELMIDPLQPEREVQKILTASDATITIEPIKERFVVEKKLETQTAEKVQRKLSQKEKEALETARKEEQLKRFQKDLKRIQQELEKRNISPLDDKVAIKSSFVTGNVAQQKKAVPEETKTPSKEKKPKNKKPSQTTGLTQTTEKPDPFLDAEYQKAMARNAQASQAASAVETVQKEQPKRLTLKERQEISRLEKEKADFENEINKDLNKASSLFKEKNFQESAALYARVFKKTGSPFHGLKLADALKSNKEYEKALEIFNIVKRSSMQFTPQLNFHFFIDRSICLLKAAPNRETEKEIQNIYPQIQALKANDSDEKLRRLSILENLLLIKGKHPEYPELCQIDEEHETTNCAHTKLRELARYLPPSITMAKNFADGKGGPIDLKTALKITKPLLEDPTTPYNIIIDIAYFHILNNDSENAFSCFKQTLERIEKPEEIRSAILYFKKMSEYLDLKQATEIQLEGFNKIPKENLTDQDLFNWAYVHIHCADGLLNIDKRQQHLKEARALFESITEGDFHQRALVMVHLLAGPDSGLAVPQLPQDELYLFNSFKYRIMAIQEKDEQKQTELIKQSNAHLDNCSTNQHLMILVPLFSRFILHSDTLATSTPAELIPELKQWAEFCLEQQNPNIQRYLKSLFSNPGIQGNKKLLENVRTKLDNPEFDALLADTKELLKYTLNLFGSTFIKEDLEPIVDMVNKRMSQMTPSQKATLTYLKEIKKMIIARLEQ